MKYDQFYYEYEQDRGDELEEYPPPIRGGLTFGETLGTIVSSVVTAFLVIFTFEWLFGSDF